MKKDDEISKLTEKMQEFEKHINRIQDTWEERLHSLEQEKNLVSNERDQIIITLRERNEELENLRKSQSKEINQMKS